MQRHPAVDIDAKVLELVKYCEDEYDLDFIIRKDKSGKIRMYRIK